MSKTDPIDPLSTTPTGGARKRAAPPAAQFQSAMQKASSQTGSMAPTPMQAAVPNLTMQRSPEALATQAQQMQRGMGDLATQLQANPKLKLRSDQNTLLTKKLRNATTQLRALNEQLGVTPPPVASTSSRSPFSKLLGYLDDGQNQLETAHRSLRELGSNGQPLNPGDFLQIQAKLARAQQEIEFASTVLGNAVNAFKMLMQVQL